jgi:hypothetical protein
MSIFLPAAHADRTARQRVRRVLATTAVFSTGLAAISPAFAAELVTAELVGTQNVVEVEQGRTAGFNINLSASGNAACRSTHTATVKNIFSISGGSAPAVSTGTSFSDAVSFSAPGKGDGNCDITGGGTVAAQISAASNTPVGTYTATLSTAAGTTRVTSTNEQGGKLEDKTATTLTFRVVAPTNTAPASGNAPANATGNEGSTLSTSGSFTDVDGNLSSIAVSSGAGTVTADRNADGKLSGSWSWSLPTTDNVSGSVTVTATDAGGLTASQSFTYAASNVAPRVTVAASNANGNEGDTLRTRGTFQDVSGDPLTITKVSGAGAVVDNRDGTWTWSLATTNETSGTVVVQADDGDGGTFADSFDFRAVNVAPGVRTPALDPVGDEGSTISASGAFSDVAADALTITKAGVGGLVDNGDGSWGWRLATTDDGTGTVTVTATDGSLTADDAFTYTVRNVAPAVAVKANDVSGDEGTTITGGGRFSDVAADDLTITKVSGPGTVTGNADGTWTWTYDAADNHTAQDVVVKAVDGDGGEETDTFSVTVRNAAPIVVNAASDATGSEGNTLVTQGKFADVPADTVSITKTAGAGTLVTNADGSWSWSLATTDQTSGTVEITATDEDGGITKDTFTYEAVDVAPQLARAAADATGNEGDTLTTSGDFLDVAADAIKVVKVSGPGTVTDNGGGNWSYSLPTTDEVSGTVVVKAVDKDGVESEQDSFAVRADNVAPAVGSAPENSSGSEGGTLTTSGSFTDVAADRITITKQDGEGTVTDNGDGTWSWSLTTTDEATGSVTVKADDGDEGVTTSTFNYAASNVTPVLSALTVTGATGTACTTGNTVGVKFTVTDPGSADTMTGTINWGDGQTSPFTSRSVDTTHAYAPGNYTITVNVSDDDGAAAVAKTAAVSRNYAIGAIQSPFNADGSSVFKYGSTVPVKVRITDCANVSVTTLAPTIRVALASSATPSTAINTTVDSTSSADTTGVMRYDATAGQYIYNMATKSLADGDAKYVVKVADAGASVQQGFGLRTK